MWHNLAREITLFGWQLPVWVVLPCFFAVWIFVGLAIKKVVFRAARFLARKTEWKFDDIFIESLNIPAYIFIAVLGVVVGVEYLLPRDEGVLLTRYSALSLKIGTLLSLVAFVDQFASRLIDTYSIHVEVLRISQSLAKGFLHVLVLVIGGLVLLDSLGISITPIIASLGIGSLAVALALQPTLENLFSGFQIIFDKLVIPGQFVKLSSGEEGFVERVGWRSTWVRQLPNNMVVIPNKDLVNSRITNYHYPSKDQAVLIEVGVHYSSELEKVEKVTIDVGEKIMAQVKGAVSDFKPFIRYHSFQNSSINFTVILRSQEFVDGFLVKHEFIKALTDRYRKEGIVIPYPIMAVNTEQEKAQLA